MFHGFHAGKYTIDGCGNGYDGMDPNAALGSFRWKLVGGEVFQVFAWMSQEGSKRSVSGL